MAKQELEHPKGEGIILKLEQAPKPKFIFEFRVVLPDVLGNYLQ